MSLLENKVYFNYDSELVRISGFCVSYYDLVSQGCDVVSYLSYLAVIQFSVMIRGLFC